MTQVLDLVSRGDVGITISGDPVAQGRGRAVPMWGGARVIDPPRARSWKARARSLVEADMVSHRLRAPALSGPIGVFLEIIHSRPASEHRKRQPPGRQWCTRLVGDVDNVVKAALDALNGLWWADDRQVAELHAKQYIGAQGEQPSVSIRAWELEAIGARKTCR